jgi:hypothetical protein
MENSHLAFVRLEKTLSAATSGRRNARKLLNRTEATKCSMLTAINHDVREESI